MMKYFKFFFCILQLFLSFDAISSQNDDKRDIEWDLNDPRWQTKIPNWWDEDNFFPPTGPEIEKSKSFWINQGQKKLKEKLNQKLNLNKAKNLIIFIGDGMGLPTLMATRSYINDVSEELSFEKFSHTGLAKTYCINYQIPDSSCTATAILTGIKSNYGTIGVNGKVNLRECQNQNKENDTISIFEYAQNAGKSTGVVTTTRITHATPAAAYAHTSSRYWESDDGKMGKFSDCDDIAYQLIYGRVGSKLNVAFGGGKRHFITKENGGKRTDGKDLIKDFLTDTNTQFIQSRVSQFSVQYYYQLSSFSLN
jgi:alkaline phosphatase